MLQHSLTSFWYLFQQLQPFFWQHLLLPSPFPAFPSAPLQDTFHPKSLQVFNASQQFRPHFYQRLLQKELEPETRSIQCPP